MDNIPKNSGLVGKYIEYPLANIFVPLFYKLGFTPNNVTTLTLVLRIIVIYNLYYKKNYALVIILFIISWITDGIDGQLARNYNMKSKFGAIYDVFVDDMSFIVILIILYKKYYSKNIKKFMIFIFILLFLYIIKYSKLSCNSKDKNLKIWEKKINDFNLKLTKEQCRNINIINNYDEGFNYITYILFLIYTLYFKS